MHALYAITCHKKDTWNFPFSFWNQLIVFIKNLAMWYVLFQSRVYQGSYRTLCKMADID